MACPRCNGLLLDDPDDGLRCVNCGFRQHLQLLFLQHAFSSASPQSSHPHSHSPELSADHKRTIARERRRWLRERSRVTYSPDEESDPDGMSSIRDEASEQP